MMFFIKKLAKFTTFIQNHIKIRSKIFDYDELIKKDNKQ